MSIRYICLCVYIFWSRIHHIFGFHLFIYLFIYLFTLPALDHTSCPTLTTSSSAVFKPCCASIAFLSDLSLQIKYEPSTWKLSWLNGFSKSKKWILLKLFASCNDRKGSYISFKVCRIFAYSARISFLVCDMELYTGHICMVSTVLSITEHM